MQTETMPGDPAMARKSLEQHTICKFQCKFCPRNRSLPREMLFIMYGGNLLALAFLGAWRPQSNISASVPGRVADASALELTHFKHVRGNMNGYEHKDLYERYNDRLLAMQTAEILAPRMHQDTMKYHRAQMGQPVACSGRFLRDSDSCLYNSLISD